MDDSTLEQQRQASRAMWADGHYPTVAEHLRPAAQRLVDTAGVADGDRVLDVGTGSGAVALAAARRGAEVLGIDQIDTWFDEARAQADVEGLRIDLQVADATDLPVAAGTFDVVLSSFAHIFVPRHDVVAGAMARACRVGGTVGCTAWAHEDDGHSGAFAIVERYLGADDGPSNSDWGDSSYLRDRFVPHGVDMTVQRHAVSWRFPSPQAHEDFLLTASGPYRMTREALEASGVWEQAWAEIRALDRQANEADDGTFAMEQAYLLAVGRRR